jgi:hypothetical protein
MKTARTLPTPLAHALREDAVAPARAKVLGLFFAPAPTVPNPARGKVIAFPRKTP